MSRREKIIVILAAISVVGYLTFWLIGHFNGPSKGQGEQSSTPPVEEMSSTDRPETLSDQGKPEAEKEKSVRSKAENLISGFFPESLSDAEWSMLRIGDSVQPKSPVFGLPPEPPPQPKDLPAYAGYLDTPRGRYAFLNGRAYKAGEFVEGTRFLVLEIHDISVILGWNDAVFSVQRFDKEKSDGSGTDQVEYPATPSDLNTNPLSGKNRQRSFSLEEYIHRPVIQRRLE